MYVRLLNTVLGEKKRVPRSSFKSLQQRKQNMNENKDSCAQAHRKILAMGFVVIRLTFAVNTCVLIEDKFSPDLLGSLNKNIINVAM